MKPARAFVIGAILAMGPFAAAMSQDRLSGYLAPGEFDVTPILEPAPRPGDPRYDSDRRIFRATRALRGTPRWQIAVQDADYSTPALLRTFSCSVGVTLTRENAPKLVTLLQRASADTVSQMSHAKDVFARQRPFMIDKGPVCQPTSELFDKAQGRMSFDYPSGHTTLGWTWGLILTSVAPDRAQQILQRARAYGESRFICGAHNASAVAAGMQAATATMGLVVSKVAFQEDLRAARAEMVTLRAGNASAPSGCAAEAYLMAQQARPG